MFDDDAAVTCPAFVAQGVRVPCGAVFGHRRMLPHKAHSPIGNGPNWKAVRSVLRRLQVYAAVPAAVRPNRKPTILNGQHGAIQPVSVGLACVALRQKWGANQHF
ncbi:MAG: hypothetical protein LBV49_07280 [Azonexus sp.]|nr:hypothetical protein [Azonexus sp.]